MTWRFPSPPGLGAIALAKAGGIRKAPLIPEEAAPDPLTDMILRIYRERGQALSTPLARALRESVEQTTIPKLMRAIAAGQVNALQSAIDWVQY